VVLFHVLTACVPVFSIVYGRTIRARIKTTNTYSYDIDFINMYDLQYDLTRYVRRNTARILVYGSPDILNSIRKKLDQKIGSPNYTRALEIASPSR
jgi:hypothetical protein